MAAENEFDAKAPTSVGVVIPTIGRDSLIRAITSVREQTRLCNRIVVVLDRPEMRGVVQSILRPDEILIVTTGALGGSACRNLGLDAVVEDFVCFLDDDDWWHPEKLESQVKAVDAQATCLSFTASVFHEVGRPERRLPRQPFTGRSVASYLVQRRHLTHGDGYIQTSSLMVRTSLAQDIRWDESLPKHQDWDFVIRLFDHPKMEFSYVEKPLVNVVKDSPGSISKQADWRASVRWFDRHQSKLERRAGGDFVCTHILRSALAGMSVEGVRMSLVLMRGRIPHLAAVVVGLYGCITAFRNVRSSRSQNRSSRKNRPGIKSVFKRQVRTGMSYMEIALFEAILGIFLCVRRFLLSEASGNILIAPPGGGNIGDQAMVDAFIQNVEGHCTVVVKSVDDFIADTYPGRGGTDCVVMPKLLYASGVGFVSDLVRLLYIISRSRSVSVIGADIMDGAYNLTASVRRSCIARAGAALTGNARVVGFSWNGSAPRVARYALRRAGTLGVAMLLRDPISYERAVQDRIPSAHLVMDSVFSLKSGHRSVAQANKVLSEVGDRPFVLINASGLVEQSVSQVEPYVDVIRDLEFRGFVPVLLPHVIRRSGDDLEICNLIASKVDFVETIVVQTLLSPDEVRHLCDKATFSITGRMHLGVISLSVGKPSIVIGTQGKVEGLMKFFDISNLLVNPSAELGSEILTAVEYLAVDRNGVSGAVADGLERAVELSTRNFAGL